MASVLSGHPDMVIHKQFRFMSIKNGYFFKTYICVKRDY